MTKYEIMFEALQERVNSGELTIEDAQILNDVAYEKYADDDTEYEEVTESSDNEGITYEEYLESMEEELFGGNIIEEKSARGFHKKFAKLKSDEEDGEIETNGWSATHTHKVNNRNGQLLTKHTHTQHTQPGFHDAKKIKKSFDDTKGLNLNDEHQTQDVATKIANAASYKHAIRSKYVK